MRRDWTITISRERPRTARWCFLIPAIAPREQAWDVAGDATSYRHRMPSTRDGPSLNPRRCVCHFCVTWEGVLAKAFPHPHPHPQSSPT